MSQSWYNCSFLAGGLLSQHTCSFQSHADIKHVKRRLELQPLPDDRSHKMIIEAFKKASFTSTLDTPVDCYRGSLD